MIDRQKELQENLDMLSSFTSLSFGEDVPEQSRIMDSSKINTAMKSMENALNSLYEKARALEDATNYTRSFLMEEIVTRRKTIDNKLEEIEKSRDSLKSNTYIAEVVHLHKRGERSIRDRDGSSIPSCGLKDKKLTLSGQVLEEINTRGMTRSLMYQSEGSYFQGGMVSTYATRYRMEDKPQGGVLEKVSFLFKEVKDLSFVEAIPSNCTIAEVAFINENDAEQIVPQTNMYQFYPVKAKGVTMTLSCKNPSRLDLKKESVSTGPWEGYRSEDPIIYYERDASSIHERAVYKQQLEEIDRFRKSVIEDTKLHTKHKEQEELKADMGRA